MKLNRASVKKLDAIRTRVSLEPDNFRARLELAQCLARLGFLRDAAAEFRKLIDIRPTGRELKFQLHKILNQSERFDEAIKLLEAMLDNDPKPHQVHYRIGKTAEKGGQSLLATKHYRLAIETSPKDSFETGTVNLRVATVEYVPDRSFQVSVLSNILENLTVSEPAVKSALLKLASIDACHSSVRRAMKSWMDGRPKIETTWFYPAISKIWEKDNEAAKAYLLLLPGMYRTKSIWCGLMRQVDPEWFRWDSSLNYSHSDASPPSDIAAVTCYFNANNSVTRRESYNIFRANLLATGVPLLTVELAFGDAPFELEKSEDVIQVRSDSRMWQKERLLNIGIDKLIQRGFEKVAWLDADIVFEDPDWGQIVSSTLEDVPVCQAFDMVYRQRWEADPGFYEIGFAYFDDIPQINLKDKVWVTGFAWAARADLLKSVPLYDANITGGGDLDIAFACLGNKAQKHLRMRHDKTLNELPSGMFTHYREWSKAWGEQVKGKFGYAPTSIQTLYHGAISDRMYQQRKKTLKRLNYSPESDIEIDDNRCWKWATSNPQLHKMVDDRLSGRMDSQ